MGFHGLGFRLWGLGYSMGLRVVLSMGYRSAILAVSRGFGF